jgi:hypothetical protein
MVSKGLRTWFYVHFAVDMIIGIPLLLFPIAFGSFFNIELIEVTTARIVGAALIAIGGMSFLMNKRNLAEYKLMLELKILWSFFAIIGLLLSLNSEKVLYLFILVFLIFFLVWTYYYKKLLSSS